jgi:hypothetical protein
MLLVAIDEELIVAVDPIDVMERKYLTVNVDKMLSYIDTPNNVGRRLSILRPFTMGFWNERGTTIHRVEKRLEKGPMG